MKKEERRTGKFRLFLSVDGTELTKTIGDTPVVDFVTVKCG